MFSQAAFVPNSLLNTHVELETTMCSLLLYIFTSIWSKPETNARKMEACRHFALNPFRPRWHRCTGTFHWLRLWALLMDHGVWFFDSWTAEVCCERRNKPGIQQPKRWIQQPRFFNNQKIKGQQPKKKRFQQPTDSVCWLVELDLDCKLRIIMTWG